MKMAAAWSAAAALLAPLWAANAVQGLGFVALPEDEDAIEEEPPTELSWCRKKRYVLTHHRAGGTVAHSAVLAFNAMLLLHCPPSEVRLVSLAGAGINFNHSSPIPDQCSRVDPDSADPLAEAAHAADLGKVSSVPPMPEDALVLHVERNAMEMVVSSYAYDLLGKEPAWQQGPVSPFDHCRRFYHEHFGEEQSELYECTSGISPHCAGIDAAVVAARPADGVLAEYLPEIDPEDAAMAGAPRESWANYLARVGEDEGLLAEALMMRTLALRNMAQVRARLEPAIESGEGQIVCLSAFEERTMAECRAMWERVALGFGFPWHVARNASQTIAEQACSAERRAAALPLNRTEAADRVARLTRLDDELLNGSIAQLSGYIQCPLSPRYQPGGDIDDLTAVQRLLQYARRRQAARRMRLNAIDERTIFPRKEII